MERRAKSANWPAIFGIAAVVLGLYAVRVYSSLYEVSPAYVYHPASDRIYRLVLKPSISSLDYWTVLVPFRSPFFGEVDYVEYIGQLGPRLRDVEEDRRLIREDLKGWSKKQDEKMKQLLATSAHDVRLDVQYYALMDSPKNPYEVVPKAFEAVKKHSDRKPPNVFFADVVVVKHPWKGSVEVEVLREAIFIRGAAAYEVAALEL